MLMAHPILLQRLVSEYETLQDLQTQSQSSHTEQRMQDVTYTLCVSTGTRDIDTALIAARHQLPVARPEDESVLAAG
ncbi:DUF5133 domain-containing protein [Streptomyces fagopyri]|uniref:DUF5133 domain-containing protein n=1 Tax=Streptomyces fagopyri TaxID=2662397 RepID=UPI00367535F5